MDACKNTREREAISFLPTQERRKKPLAAAVHTALELYFHDLDGHDLNDLYKVIMTEIERPLLEITLRHTGGNLSKAADVLGINRATLRKKLGQHSLL